MKLRPLALSAFVLLGLTGAAVAQAGGATQLNTFKDWNAFTSNTADGKMCFIATQPKDSKYSQPASGRDPAYFQITRIPTKGVVNEVSSIVGYTFGSNADVTIDVDGAKFKMFLDASHPDTAWSVQETEVALVEAMKKGHAMTLTSTSRRGTQITDSYSLAGISAALDAVTKECP
ncbi:MAG TPA: invasion associated locus B family protein [Bauldia sp.]|nr:invasion associated locus B family protein [Bauldia sp.]